MGFLIVRGLSTYLVLEWSDFFLTFPGILIKATNSCINGCKSICFWEIITYKMQTIYTLIAIVCIYIMEWTWDDIHLIFIFGRIKMYLITNQFSFLLLLHPIDRVYLCFQQLATRILQKYGCHHCWLFYWIHCSKI